MADRVVVGRSGSHPVASPVAAPGGARHTSPMPQARQTTPGAPYTCPHCAAVYEMTRSHRAARERITVECEVCRQRMGEWDDDTSRRFRLVRGIWPAPEEDLEND